MGDRRGRYYYHPPLPQPTPTPAAAPRPYTLRNLDPISNTAEKYDAVTGAFLGIHYFQRNPE
jgi:hypothetical protein